MLEIYRPQRMLRSNSDGYTLVIPWTRNSYGDKSFRVSVKNYELKHPASVRLIKQYTFNIFH